MVASGVVVAALTIGAGVALWEANEAKQQRAQAEDLIEFMLGDLRKKLQPVGRLDVLDAAALGIAEARPKIRFELASNWGWIAKVREAKGDFEAAIEAQRTNIEVLGKLPEVDKNRRAQQLLANASYELVRLQLMLGRYDPARQMAQDSLTRITAPVDLDSSNTERLAHMIFARLGLAESETALNRQAAAGANLERAARDVTRLLSTDATRNKWNVALAGSLLLNRMALTDTPAPPRAEVDAFAATVKSAAVGSKLLDAEQTRIASAVELALGDLFANDSQPDAASAHWQAAAERVQSRAAKGEPPAMTLLAQGRLRLGATEEARALAVRVEESPYRHPAYADLRQRLAAAAGAVPGRP